MALFRSQLHHFIFSFTSTVSLISVSNFYFFLLILFWSPLWEMVQEGIDLKSIKWTQHWTPPTSCLLPSCRKKDQSYKRFLGRFHFLFDTNTHKLPVRLEVPSQPKLLCREMLLGVDKQLDSFCFSVRLLQSLRCGSTVMEKREVL